MDQSHAAVDGVKTHGNERHIMRLIVITATTNPQRALPCLQSWGDVPIVVVVNGASPLPSEASPHNITWLTSDDYLGTVAAFRWGVDFALERTEADVLANLHDDLAITEVGWDQQVLRHFERQPACGLAGFGGAIGLGSDRIYQDPYHPMQLARIGFRSNLRDAELHGIRSLLPERVACLDGFSQIGRKEFWSGMHRVQPEQFLPTLSRPWAVLDDLGVVHHFYDGLLGCLARRAGWETWYLPIACHHYGGRTAVGDAGYQTWAASQIAGGDASFWAQAHSIGYDAFRDVLPLRV
jgi:hypothetical protein